jgi:hypothetical protein
MSERASLVIKAAAALIRRSGSRGTLKFDAKVVDSEEPLFFIFQQEN